MEPPQDLNQLPPEADDDDDADIAAMEHLVRALDRLYACLLATTALDPAVLPSEHVAAPRGVVRRELDALEAAAHEYARAYERVKRRGLFDPEDPPAQGEASR